MCVSLHSKCECVGDYNGEFACGSVSNESNSFQEIKLKIFLHSKYEFLRQKDETIICCPL